MASGEFELSHNRLRGGANLTAASTFNSHNNWSHQTIFQSPQSKQKVTIIKLLTIALSIITLAVVLAPALAPILKLATSNSRSQSSSSSGPSLPSSSTLCLLSTTSQNTTSPTNHQTSETTSLIALLSSTTTSSTQSQSPHNSPAPSLSQQPPSTLALAKPPQFSSTIAPSTSSALTKNISTLSPQTTRSPSSTSVTGLAPGLPCTADNQCRSPNGCYTHTGTTTITFCCGPEYPGCPGSPCTANECLDPYGCRTEAGTCCGLPPYTRLAGPTCYA